MTKNTASGKACWGQTLELIAKTRQFTSVKCFMTLTLQDLADDEEINSEIAKQQNLLKPGFNFVQN
jgi:hypothetical protein